MILIVDDYADGAKALCRLLTQEGYPCESASNGPDAIAKILARLPGQPLLVILDDQMPEMSGTETLRAIRADARIAHTSIILFSTGYDVAKRDEAIKLGAIAWYTKGGTVSMDPPSLLNELSIWYERLGGVKLLAP